MNNLVKIAILSFFSPFAFNQINLLNENFQSGIPNNWSVVDNDFQLPVDTDYSEAWISITDPENDLDTIAASTSYFAPTGTASRWLITPPLALGTFGNTLSWKAKSHDASFPDDYLILVSTTDNQIGSFGDTIGYIQEENFEWTQRSADLSAEGYNGQTIYIAFINTTNDGFKLYLDSIVVEKDDPVSLPSLSKEEFNLFPNPAQDQIQLITSHDITSVRILDLSGKLILKQQSKTIRVSELNPGIYFIEALINGTSISKKMIKE
jgi:hypothetical protein